MAVVLLIGITLLALSTKIPHATLWHDLVRDLGIATVVSFCVTIVIEYYSAQRREADIRTGVLDAIVGKIVPPLVWAEIRTNVIGDPALCEEWHLQTIFKKERVTPLAGGPDEDRYVAHSTLTYRLNNLINKRQLVILRHELEFDISGKQKYESENEVELPRFEKLACASTSGEKLEWSGGQLKAGTHWKDYMLEIPIELPRDGSVEIVLTRAEILPFPGGFPWYMFWVTLNPHITVISDLTEFEFSILPRHPDREALRPVGPQEWKFNGVMLPGQGFEIVIARKQPSALQPKQVSADSPTA